MTTITITVYLKNHVGLLPDRRLLLQGWELSQAKPDLAPTPNFYAPKPGLADGRD